MPPRAVWKGALRIAELQCPVALYTAVSKSERIAFHTVNRDTGHRLQRQFVDSETGSVVPAEDQVKGYDSGSGQVVTLEPEEIAAAVPDNDKTLAVSTFLACETIDTVYFDRPYYLLPGDPVGAPTLSLLRDGLRTKKVAALASAILFRRVRTVLIRAHDDDLIATLLKFDYEVRSSSAAFDDVAPVTIEPEMIDLASHIIKTKTGTFDPRAFDDRYEEAVAEMVRAKMEGRAPAAKPRPTVSTASDLLTALRESAQASGQPRRKASGSAPAKRAKAPAAAAKATPRRKAG